ncbi:hypothetical protein B0H13DRAFT_2425635 [Mycena leptocephala]|nr:hypothetical protein B0H13DRAFT_2425635 [Mycena leptocephala]
MIIPGLISRWRASPHCNVGTLGTGNDLASTTAACESLVANDFHSRLRSVRRGSHVDNFHFARNANFSFSFRGDDTHRFHRTCGVLAECQFYAANKRPPPFLDSSSPILAGRNSQGNSCRIRNALRVLRALDQGHWAKVALTVTTVNLWQPIQLQREEPTASEPEPPDSGASPYNRHPTGAAPAEIVYDGHDDGPSSSQSVATGSTSSSPLVPLRRTRRDVSGESTPVRPCKRLRQSQSSSTIAAGSSSAINPFIVLYTTPEPRPVLNSPFAMLMQLDASSNSGLTEVQVRKLFVQYSGCELFATTSALEDHNCRPSTILATEIIDLTADD